MTQELGSSWSVAAVLLVAACSSGGGGGAAAAAAVQRACDAVEACAGVQEGMDCLQSFELVVPPNGCLEAVETATCEEHTATTPAYADACFPACESPGEQRCVGGGVLSVCGDLADGPRELWLDCAAVCETEGYDFSGTCGLTYGSDVSAKPVCWCAAPSGSIGLGMR